MSLCLKLKISTVSGDTRQQMSHACVYVLFVCLFVCLFFLVLQTMWMKYLETNLCGQLILTRRLLGNCWSVTLAMRYVWMSYYKAMIHNTFHWSDECIAIWIHLTPECCSSRLMSITELNHLNPTTVLACKLRIQWSSGSFSPNRQQA